MRDHHLVDPSIKTLGQAAQIEHYKRVATGPADKPLERWDRAYALLWLDEHKVPGFIRPEQPPRPDPGPPVAPDPAPAESEYVRIEIEELRPICEFFARLALQLPPRRRRKGGSR